MSTGTRILLEKAAKGDSRAGKELWGYWVPRLALFLRTHSMFNEEDREDLLQDIMEKVFSSLNKYNSFYAPSTWIYTIARRTVIDRQILFLTCYEEMSGRGAAKVLDLPSSTVRDRLKYLKKELEEIWDEEER